MQQDKKNVISILDSYIHKLLEKNKVEVLIGKAVAGNNNHEVIVNNKNYQGKNIILATGSFPRILANIPGIESGYKFGTVITSTEILELPKIPSSLVIIGGGVIGIEFACLFNSLHAEVTILQG